MVVAITTCTANAAVAPSQTAKGRPRVAMTREANMVLSGSSPRKITGKTAATTARFTLALFCTASRANLPAGMRTRLHPGHGRTHDGWNEGLAHLHSAQAWQPGAVGASMSITSRGLLPFGAHDSAAGADD